MKVYVGVILMLTNGLKILHILLKVLALAMEKLSVNCAARSVVRS